jgi:hypothetical protein
MRPADAEYEPLEKGMKEEGRSEASQPALVGQQSFVAVNKDNAKPSALDSEEACGYLCC